MSTRLMTLVERPEGKPLSRHFRGLPPELTDGNDNRKELAWPRVIVIEEKPSGIFLFRFADNGSCVGDTWHMSVEEAKKQAEYEYGNFLAEWQRVPSDVDDPVAFALEQAE